MYKMKHYW